MRHYILVLEQTPRSYERTYRVAYREDSDPLGPYVIDNDIPPFEKEEMAETMRRALIEQQTETGKAESN